MKFDVGIEYKKLTGIYQITDTLSYKFYIGSASRCLYTRYHQHISELRKNRHTNRHLQAIFNKRSECLVFSVVELCEPEVCIQREQYYIDLLAPIINVNKKAESRLGMKMSEETLQKMRGRIISEETREKIRQARLQQVISDEVIARRNNTIRGIFNTPISCSNGMTYASLKEASQLLGIPDSSISRVLRGITPVSRTRHGLSFWYTNGKSNGALLRNKQSA